MLASILRNLGVVNRARNFIPISKSTTRRSAGALNARKIGQLYDLSLRF